MSGRRPLSAGVRAVAALLVLLAVTVVAGSILVALVPGDGTAVDVAVLEAFHRERTPARSTVWSVVTDAGAGVFLLPAAVAIGTVWRWRRHDWLALQLLAGAYAGAALLHTLAKPIVGRARPGAELAFTPETGLAFPSGHATQASAFWVALALLALSAVRGRGWRIVIAAAAASVVVLVAVSRLYLGAHWVTDVAAGTVLGTAWAGALGWSLPRRAGPPGSVRADRS